jgi:integrase
LHLEAAWTKNRKDGFLPLPRELAEQLRDFSETALEHYHRVYTKIPQYVPERPLLFVMRETARELDKDLKAAGIPKVTKEGKIDFHALRVTYINMVIASDVTVKEAQTLARHTTPHMTMNVYGRTREDRLAEIVEKIAQYAPGMSSPENDDDQDDDNPFPHNDLGTKDTPHEWGFKSPLRHAPARTQP